MIVSIPKWMITTSRRQGHFREEMSEGSPSANLRADEQKSHKRLSLWGEWAQDHETLWFRRYGKCGSCAEKVHVLIWGDLPHMRFFGAAPASEMMSVMRQKTENCSCIFCIHAIPGVISRRHSSWRSQDLTQDEGQNINQGRRQGWRR